MLKTTPNLGPPPLAWLHHAPTLDHVRECSQTICTIILNTLATPYDKTTRIFHLFHPLDEIDISFLINDFYFETNVILDWETFISTLTHSPHLFFRWPLEYGVLTFTKFVLDNFVNGFDLFFEVCRHITQGHVTTSILHFLFVFKLLRLKK
jgi:hypothetical protein